MNNKDFIHNLSRHLEQNVKETQLNLHSFVSAFVKLLEYDSRVDLRHCGTFSSVIEKEHIEEDATTGQRYIYPPRLHLRFTFSPVSDSGLLAQFYANELHLSLSDAEHFITQFTDVLLSGMNDDKMVKIKGFGTFKDIITSDAAGQEVSQWVFEPDESFETAINKPFEDFPSEPIHTEMSNEELNNIDKAFAGKGVLSSTHTEELAATDDHKKTDENAAEENHIASSEDTQTETTKTVETQEETEANSDTPSTTDTPTEKEDTEVISEADKVEANHSEEVTTDTESVSTDMSVEQDTKEPTPLSSSTKKEEDPTSAASETTTPTSSDAVSFDAKVSFTQEQLEAYVDERLHTRLEEAMAQEREEWEQRLQQLEQQLSELTAQQKQELDALKEEVRNEATEREEEAATENDEATYFEEEPRHHRRWFNILCIIVFLSILGIFGYYYAYPYLSHRQFKEAPTVAVNPDTVTTLADSVATDSLHVTVCDTTVQNPALIYKEGKEETTVHSTTKKSKTESVTQNKEKDKKSADTKSSISPSTATATPNTNTTKADIPAPTSYRSNVIYRIVGTMQEHTIQRGEGIYSLARKYYKNKDMAKYIVRYNKIEDPDNIQVGQTIKIPSLRP